MVDVMRCLINYIRSCFCKHEYELLNKSNVYQNIDICVKGTEPHIIGHMWTYKCKKCGYCYTYKDF